MKFRKSVVGTVLCSLLAVSCANHAITPADGPGGSAVSNSAEMASEPFEATGSISQAFVQHGTPGVNVELLDASGNAVDEGEIDEYGSLVFRLVEPADGYVVKAVGSNGYESEAFTVWDSENSKPDQGFYDSQDIEEGFGYITTRDGTKLSYSTYFPTGEGPFPTVVEYSGYDPSNPTKDLLETVEDFGLDESICTTIKIICEEPAQPSSLIAAAMGYAVVAVNVRGTGCSGGAYDFFDELQLQDGYDVIETVAAQDWVRGKVGMVGLSYPGISQLYVASTQPPSLAAIAPLSVFDDAAKGVLAPGGIFNEGFALEWADSVLNDAAPLGQGWEEEVIEGGDETCAENQNMRAQNVDVVAKAKSYPFYTDDVAGPLDIAAFADKINVPIYSSGSWQDEQTGPRFVNLWDKFESSPYTRLVAFNGAHADGYSPEDLVEWKLFLDFFVGGERTPIPEFFSGFGPVLFADIFKATIAFPQDRLIDGDFEELKAEYMAEDPIRIRWERGNSDPLGAPLEAASSTFATWPPASQGVERFYFGPDGALSESAPTTSDSSSSFTTNPELAGMTTLPGDKGGQAFWAEPEWEWNYYESDDAMTFVSEPLDEDLVMLGSGRADLWIRSSEPSADIGVTLSEVRPDDKETYVQSGILRTTHRTLGPNATETFADARGYEADASDLVPGEWTEATVEIMPVGHIFRAGSRIAFSVHSPGGDQTRWSWILDDFDSPPVVDVGHDPEHPSSIAISTVSGVSGYPAELPPCPSLRGQPCRDYEVFENSSS